MIATTERDDLKERLDCRTVAERLLGEPQQRSGRAWHWLCPFHNDRSTPSLAVYPDGWRCFGCQVQGDHYDLVLRVNHCRFDVAHAWLVALAGGTLAGSPPVKRNGHVHKSSTNDRWKAKQTDWRRLVDNSLLRLDTGDGDPGRIYLVRRGIKPETWQAWGVGYVSNVLRRWKDNDEWHTEDLGPAISLPWTNGKTIKAVQYRLLNHAQRYHQEAGGERTIFGAQHLGESLRSALIIVEGELNAVSIWQAAHDLVDVVSFGPEGNVGKAAEHLRQLAGRYGRVIVWADKPEVALMAQQALAGADMALKSPGGFDANDLLQQDLLRDFIVEVTGRLPDSRFDDVLVERSFQRLRAAGQHDLMMEFDSFVALETRCGELHAKLVETPHDLALQALYDGYAAAWLLCRGL